MGAGMVNRERRPKDLRGVRCLVTGAGGFIGTNLCRALIGRGADVRGFGRRPRFPESIEGVEWFEGSLGNRCSLQAAISGRNIVYHLLGPSAPGGLQQEVARDLAQSATDTLALLDLCRQSDVERFVFASSGGTVYGAASRAPVTEDTMLAPITPYGVSKLVSEHFIRLYERLYGLAGISLRIANPFGPYQLNVHSQGIVAAALERGLQAGQIEIWGDGEIVRDFIYIDDVCSAFINALTYTGSERTFNIGSGIGRSINSVLHDLGRLLPTPGLECVYRPGRQVDAPINVLCNELACVELDWSPSTSWEEGLELTLRWMIEYHEACEIRKS